MSREQIKMDIVRYEREFDSLRVQLREKKEQLLDCDELKFKIQNTNEEIYHRIGSRKYKLEQMIVDSKKVKMFLGYQTMMSNMLSNDDVRKMMQSMDDSLMKIDYNKRKIEDEIADIRNRMNRMDRLIDDCQSDLNRMERD